MGPILTKILITSSYTEFHKFLKSPLDLFIAKVNSISKEWFLKPKCSRIFWKNSFENMLMYVNRNKLFCSKTMNFSKIFVNKPMLHKNFERQSVIVYVYALFLSFICYLLSIPISSFRIFYSNLNHKHIRRQYIFLFSKQIFNRLQ